MEKLFKYTGVPLTMHESVKAIAYKPYIDVVTGYGKCVGKCQVWGMVEGEVFCTVEATVDLKGKYPMLNGLIDHEGLMEPFRLIASDDRLNADEALEPFI